MSKNPLSSLNVAVIAAALNILLTVAGARPAAAQSIVNQVAGIQQIDGTYLWQYQVTSGDRPAISHWVLSTCEDVFDSLVAGSLTGTSRIEFVIDDNKTGTTGIKFDEGFSDGEVRTISFRLSEDWAPVTTTASMKSGQEVAHLSIIGPDCELRTTAVPESGTAELALVAAALPLAAMVLRRRRNRRTACRNR